MTPKKPTRKSDAESLAVASMKIARQPDGICIRFIGRLDHRTSGRCWRKTLRLLDRQVRPIRIDASALESADGSGIALLAYFKEFGRANNVPVEIEHLAAPLAALLERYLEEPDVEAVVPPPALSVVERIGKLTVELVGDVCGQITFLGRLVLAGMKTIFQPQRFRVGDFLRFCELAGANAMGLILMLGFLFGLIMAFSSAMPLRQFGVEIYVADLVALALVRVLGPFITAVIVAGRTGSAFAAEIGTMKINNELDALAVMNLDPAVFLVLPRVGATLLMTPLLAVAVNFAGLVGSGLVILSLGYPLVTYTTHVQKILVGTDVAVGLTKALVFGGMIGAVGCLRGLQTQSGPGAVGIATTRAVVTAIVLLVVLEGIFSVMLYYLEI